MLAVLLDPEKTPLKALPPLCRILAESPVDFVLVGGSGYLADTGAFVRCLKEQMDKPVLLFPGDMSQFTPAADALLLLALLSGRNAEYLIGQHVKAAMAIRESGIETLPTGYILVDGGRTSSVERASRTRALTAPEEIAVTAVAAEQAGKRLVYLEAGSGAETPVSIGIIRQVRTLISCPLIVGGGICSVTQMQAAFRAGADIVVIGNHFEQHPADIRLFAETKEQSNRPSTQHTSSSTQHTS